jgi:predicted ATPase
MYLRSDGGNLAAFLFRLRNNEQFVPYYNRIVNTIKEVFPQFEGFSLSSESVRDGDEYIRLDWREKGNDQIFGPHMLSDGTIRFIALTVLLLQPEKLIPGVIILDEPEIGLHPWAISVLGRMIRMASKYAQIIISTQSVEMLNEFNFEDVLITEYNQEERFSTIRRPSERDFNEWLKDYSLGELWNKNVLGGTPV